MKKIRKKIALICLLCFSFLLTGCKIGNKEVIVSNTLNNRQVFRIGNVSCGLKEAKVYLVNYQNIYGTAYGLDLWQHDFGDSSLENYVKNITMQELTQVVCLDQLAKEKEMELSEEENGKTAQAAEEYFASLTEDEIAYMGVSESDIKEYYEHYALAQKVYHSLTKAVNEEVSDDEARVMEIRQIFVKDGEQAQQAYSDLQNDTEFSTVAANYNEADEISLTVERGMLPAEAEAVAFAMENGTFSEPVQTTDGYYIFYCDNKYDEEQTQQHKQDIIEQRRQDAFDAQYDPFVAQTVSKLNEKVWKNLSIQDLEQYSFAQFYEIYDKYFSEESWVEEAAPQSDTSN